MKTLLKILIFIVSYGNAFALAFYAINSFNGENTPVSVWIIIAFLVIVGFVATTSKSKSSSSSYYTGGAKGHAFFLNVGGRGFQNYSFCNRWRIHCSL